MSSAPVKKGRGVLLELPNGHEPSGAAKVPAKDGAASEGTSDGEKKATAPLEVRVTPSKKPPLYTSPAVRRRSSLAANNSKRIRQSPHMKRVSFGGDTIKIISQHRNEFKSPDNGSPAESLPSPPHKARKLSHPSSPATRRSPAFAKSNQSVVAEADADDDTVTLPDAPGLSTSASVPGPPRPRIEARAKHPRVLEPPSVLSPGNGGENTLTLPEEPRLSANSMDGRPPPSPMLDVRTSPLPVRRSSLARARQSFGIFLDDEIAKGRGDLDLADVHEASYRENGMLSDQDKDEGSGDDVTTDFGNITAVLNNLLDTDESTSADVQSGSELKQSLPPIDSSPTPHHSNASSRKSLAYVGNTSLLNEATGDEEDTAKGRCSIATAFGNRILDGENDEKRRRFSVHSAMQIEDILHQVEEDENEDVDAAQYNSHGVEDIRSVSTELNRIEAVDAVQVVSGCSGNIGSKPDVAEHTAKIPTRPMQLESGGSASVRPVLSDIRKLFDGDVTEDSLHFHKTVEMPQNSQKSTAPEGKASLVQKEHSSQRDIQRGLPGHKDETSVPVSNVASIPEPLSTKQASVDKVEVQAVNHVAPRSSNRTTTPRSQTGARIRAAAAEWGVPTSAGKVSTPLSAPGSKIRASVMERPSFGKREGADSQVQQLSNSAMMSLVAKPTPRASPFSIAEFLGVSNVRFDDTIFPENRDPSLAPDMNSVEDDRSSLEWRILQSVKREKVLRRIEMEITKQEELSRATRERIARLEADIISHTSPVYSLMSKSDSVAGKEVTNCRVGLKRLRKVSHFRNRLNWVLSRQKWEGAIRDDLRTAASDCEKDITTLQESKQFLVARHASLKNVLSNCDVEWRLDDVDGPGVVDIRRKEVLDEFSYIQELRRNTFSKREAEEENLTKKKSLVPRRVQLLAKLKNLQSYAGAQADNKLKAKVTERAERNMLVCGMAGLRPNHISGNSFVATLAEMMEVDLKLSGDMVDVAIIKAATIPGDVGCFTQSFVDGAVSLTSGHTKKIRTVQEIPFVLHSSVERLLYARNFLEETVEYFDSHLGELSAATISNRELPSLDVTLVGSFYSFKAWAKFDITATISTFFPESTTGTARQEVKDFSIQRFIGLTPRAEDIQMAFETSAFKKSLHAFSVRDAFSAVWELL